MQKERIMFFVSSMRAGGAERVVQVLLNYYVRFYACDLVIISGNKSEYKLDDRINVIYLNEELNQNRVIDKLWTIVNSRNKVNKYISSMENQGYKYVLIAAHLNMAYIMALLSSKYKDVIYVIHNPQKHNRFSNSFLYRILLCGILGDKKIGVVSQGIKDELIESYGIKENHIRVLYNPVDFEYIMSNMKEEIVYSRDYILAVGRLTKEKRFDRLIDIYNEGLLYKKYDLIILGDGELRRLLEEKVINLKLEKYIKMKGFCSNPYPWMKNASILLNTSDYEALPMTLLEALLTGTRVVSSDCDYGPREILIKDYSRYLVSPVNNIQKYIEKINEALIYYPDEAEQLCKRFELKSVADSYLDYYKK